MTVADDDKTTGAYEKYKVERVDGSSKTGGKHANCRYFVIDLDHDEHAAAALHAYAESCEREFPALATDLSYTAEQIENHYMHDRGGVDTGVDLGWKRSHFWGEDKWGGRGPDETVTPRETVAVAAHERDGAVVVRLTAEVVRLRQDLATVRAAEKRARCPFALTLQESEHEKNGCCP